MNNLDKLLYVGNILNRVETLETEFRTLKSGTLKVTVLDHITNDIGLQLAGEFRSGNGLEPDYGFSGMRMGYPGFTYGSGTWALAGVNNDTLEFGVDYVTGKAWAGGGAVVLGSDGIKVYNGALLTGWWQTDGDLFLGSNLASPATTSFAYFTNAQAYNGEAMGAGDAMFGSNSAGLPNFFFDLSAGTVSFRGGTMTQAYISNTGQIVAGGGTTIIDVSGISVLAHSSWSAYNSYKFLHTNGSDANQFGLYGIESSPDMSLRLSNAGILNDGWSREVKLLASSNSATCQVYISADDLSGTNSYLRVTPTKIRLDCPTEIRLDCPTIIKLYCNGAGLNFEPTGLIMGSATHINEFSIDGTMAGNSDTALPTEKAVVTYVAAHGGGGCPARSWMGI